MCDEEKRGNKGGEGEGGGEERAFAPMFFDWRETKQTHLLSLKNELPSLLLRFLLDEAGHLI